MKIIKPRATIICNLSREEIMNHIEEAGRVCYQSEVEDPITSERFIRRIIRSGHGSVIEHISVSANVICDRGVTHEIVRHRIASYSQESTRYCNYNKDKFEEQIQVIDIRSGVRIDPVMKNLPLDVQDKIWGIWADSLIQTEEAYNAMIELGASPQMARGVLPNSLKSQLVMTMNLREWRHFLQVRCAPESHPQMREIALQLLYQFKSFLPAIFEDINYEK